MPIYEISGFSGGISDFADRGIKNSFKFGANLSIRKAVDSLTCQQTLKEEGEFDSHSPSLSVSPSATGSASPSVSASKSSSPTPSPSSSVSPSPSPTPSVSKSASPSVSVSSSVSLSPSPSSGFTTIFEGLIRTFVKASDGYTYGFDNTGCIYRRDSAGYWQKVYDDPDGEIKGAEEKPSSTGKRWLFWATDRKLKRKDLDLDWTEANVETFAQNLESCDWHTMRQVAGSLMIANKEYLAMVGYDDSYTNEALDLIPGNTAKTLVERNGRVITGTVLTGDPTVGINGAVDAEYPLAQVGTDGDIYYSDMSSSIPVKRFPGGGQVNPGGVCNEVEQINFFEWDQNALSWIDKQSVGNMALFAVYSADTGYDGIYSYGRKNKNKPFALNLDYAIDGIEELGAITSVSGTILVSYRDGPEFGVKAVDSTTKATATYYGLDFRAPVKKPTNITNWKYAEVFCSPLPAGTSIQFKYKLNKSSSFTSAMMENGSTTFTASGEKRAVFLIGEEAEIFEPQVVLTPTGNTSAEVHRVRVYFD